MGSFHDSESGTETMNLGTSSPALRAPSHPRGAEERDGERRHGSWKGSSFSGKQFHARRSSASQQRAVEDLESDGEVDDEPGYIHQRGHKRSGGHRGVKAEP